MFQRLKLLACFQLICLACGLHLSRNKPIIVCNVQLHSEMTEPFRAQLEKCNYIIVCDVTCDRSDPLLSYRGTDAGDKLSRLKDSAKQATFMLSVVVNPFELQDDEGSDRFCQEMERCMDGNLYDGIDLDVDPTMLDVADQVNYARFLRKIRRRFNTSVAISTTIGAQRMEPSSMVDALIETLSFVVLSKDDTPSIDDNSEEFVLRKYPNSMIDSMLNVGFPPEKMVLGLKAAGVLTNPLYGREQYSKKCFTVGLIPYGQVCKLRDQSKQFCSWRQDRRCLIFDGQSKVVYDSSETATERAQQCTKRNLKGVSLLVNHDDEAGVCEANEFPLLNAIVAAFDKHEDVDCGAADHGQGVKAKVDEDRLSNELNRLEKAIENIEKHTGIFNFLFRTMDKLIDVVISFAGKDNKTNSEKAGTEAETEVSGFTNSTGNLTGLVDGDVLEKVDSLNETALQDEIESIKNELPLLVEENLNISQKDVIQDQMDGNKNILELF